MMNRKWFVMFSAVLLAVILAAGTVCAAQEVHAAEAPQLEVTDSFVEGFPDVSAEVPDVEVADALAADLPDVSAEVPEVEAIEEFVDDVADAAADQSPDTQDAPDQEAADRQIGGYYIVNYAQTEGHVNVNLIFESDLPAVSQQSDTVIYHFRDDGTVTIYDRGQVSEGSYTYDETQLTISRDGAEQVYTYEFVDGLLILHEGEESSALYHFDLENGVELGDYSTIEISEASITIDDGYVEAFINSLLEGQTTTEVITEGVTEDGDIITISFSGVLEGETEPFEGGTGENYTLQLGTGTLIDNYEEQLTGQPIGETVDVTVTFPEDYDGPEALKGKTATFTTTIHSKTKVNTPELTDEWVQHYTAEYFTQQLNTVDEFRAYCRTYLQDNALHAAIFQALANKMEDVEYRNTAMAQLMLNYASINLTSTAQSYGVDAQTLAQSMGYSSAENYIQYEASSNIISALIIDRVMLDQQIRYSQDDLLAKLAEDVHMSYGSTMTVDDYITQSGAVGMWAYTNLQYKYGLTTSYLEDRVVLVP